MTSWISGLGTALPTHGISQDDAAEIVVPFNAQTEQQARVLRELYRRSGVRSRHSVVLESSTGDLKDRQRFYAPVQKDDDRGPTTAARLQRYAAHAGTLACQAAQQALTEARCEARTITHLVTASCTGFAAPGFDIDLVHSLNLRRDVARTHIGFMGCHAALNAMRVADAILRGQPNARVLLVAVELCSVHHQYGWSPDRIVSNALFSDGAGAAVIVPHAAAGTEQPRGWTIRGNHSFIVDHTESEMTWNIGDHGFEMTLSARVPDLIRQYLRGWVEEWLQRYGLEIPSVCGWAIHPGGPRILSACGEALGLSRQALSTSESVLADYGNMSSPTVLFILDRLRAQDVSGPCAMLGFGPGLTMEAALLER